MPQPRLPPAAKKRSPAEAEDCVFCAKCFEGSKAPQLESAAFFVVRLRFGRSLRRGAASLRVFFSPGFLEATFFFVFGSGAFGDVFSA